MIQCAVPPVNEPRRFEPHELFFSLTDSKGRIRYGNQVFTRVSGYREEELIGKPHNLIRHPDMPRAVFQLLWDYLEAGKTIAAYVKNLAADGRYYWVLAVVCPCRDGYLSVRLNPSTPLFEAAKSLYAEALKHESAIEQDQGKRAAIDATLPLIVERLGALGFESYDAFMHAALKAELLARPPHQNLTTGPGPSGSNVSATQLFDLLEALTSVRKRLDHVFNSLGVFETLSQQLTGKHQAMEELGPSLAVLALNAHLSATRLGDEGAVLSTVSRTLGERSKEADRLIASLVGRMNPSSQLAQKICSEIAVVGLEAEVCEVFASELLESESVENRDLVAESLTSLTEELGGRCQSVLDTLHELLANTQSMQAAAQRLDTSVSQMKIAQLNGKIDLASRPSASNFAAIFDEVAAIVVESKQDCAAILEVLQVTAECLHPLLETEAELRTDLSTIERGTEAFALAL